MNVLSPDEIKTLLGKQEGPCISLFMPTFRSGVESQQNQIRLKNLLRSSEERLLARGMRPQEVRTLLEPAQALTGNALFWRRQSDGLALFVSAGLFRCYTLPEPFGELAVVAESFHLKPLLPLMNRERFYILALSQNEIRLLEGTVRSVREIPLESVPGNLSDALQYDEFGKQVRFRAASSGGGDQGAMVSGHGAELDDTKENLLKYFRLIDRGLREILRDERAPLVLAGVDYLFPIYREANTYPRLIEEGVAGNPQGISAEALHQASLPLVAPHFRKAQRDAVAQYRQSSGTGLTSADLREIVPAAHHGRVGLLLVAADQQRWGSYDALTGAVRIDDHPQTTGEELLETAAVQTLLNGGSVFTLAAGEMPAETGLAAVFRY